MKVESVLIADIKISRDLEQGDDLSGLEASIAHLDLKIPVLLDQDNQLIDGLRRIRVFQNNGRQAIACVRSATFDQSIAHLRRTHEHGVQERPVSPRRIFLLYGDLYDQIMARMMAGREARRGKPKHLRDPIGPTRPLIAKAVGSTESILNHSHTLYRRALLNNEEGRIAAELAAQVDSGELTIHAAAGRLKMYKRVGRHGGTEQEQRQLINGLLIQATGVVNAFDRIGHIRPGITTEEIDNLTAALAAIKGKVMILGNRLRKERKERENG